MTTTSGLTGATSPQHIAGQGGDTQAIIAAKQARSDAQARIDADQRAHSPGCVAVDEKGLLKADAQLAAAQNQAQQTQLVQPPLNGESQLSVLV